MGLRILLVSENYPPFLGGAHRQVHLLAHELARRGHDVCVATNWHGGLPQEETEGGVRVFRIKQLRTSLLGADRNLSQRHSPPFPDPVTLVGLRRVIKRCRPDVVHSYGWITYAVALVLWNSKIPLVLSGRDYAYSCATQSMLYRNKLCTGPALAKCVGCASQYYGGVKGSLTVMGVRLCRSLLQRRVNGLHSVSAFVQSIFERDLFGVSHPLLERNGGPIMERVIPSFLIDTDEQASNPDFVQRLPKGPYILYVGGLQTRKGLGPLLAAYALLASPPPLVVIGYIAGAMLEAFPPGVIVLSDIQHADVMTAWKHCLFGVVPSVWPDPSPGVIREAISQGKAVISTRIGGSPEMLRNGETGSLVPPGDVPALAEAMQRLIMDKDLRARLGRAALEHSGRYRANIVVPQFEQLYSTLLASKLQVVNNAPVATSDH